MPVFEEQYECARKIIEHPKMKQENARYTFDLQVIVPLYVIAWQCPYNPLRRKAASLLLARPRREGLWDSVLAGKIGEWIIGVEVEDDEGQDWMEDDMRIESLDVNINMTTRTAALSCSNPVRLETEEGQRKITFVNRSTVVSW